MVIEGEPAPFASLSIARSDSVSSVALRIASGKGFTQSMSFARTCEQYSRNASPTIWRFDRGQAHGWPKRAENDPLWAGKLCVSRNIAEWMRLAYRRLRR